MDNLQIIYLPNTKDLKEHYWVYIHTCPNMKVYIGVTHGDKPQSRWGKSGNKYKNNQHFYNAIIKYDWNNILHEAWEVESPKQMYETEIWLIKFFESNNQKYGYNHSIGGENGCDMGKNSRSQQYRHNYKQEHKDKEQEYQRQYRQTDEYKEYKSQYYQNNKEEIREYQCQYRQSDVYKEYQREYQRQRRQSDEYKEYKREYMKDYRVKKRLEKVK